MGPPLLFAWIAPCQGQYLKLKVLGREFEGEPFFKRVSLNITCKIFCKSTALISGVLFSLCALKLAVVKLCVESVLLQKFLMISAFDYISVLHYKYHIRIPYS